MPSVRKILNVIRAATDTEYRDGLHWYPEALSICERLAQQYGQTTDTVAGMMAALSPNNSWACNVTLTARALRYGFASSTLGDSCVKADLILDGEMPLDVLGGLKVRSFYVNIITAGQTDIVCIDRHAWNIVHGRGAYGKSSITPHKYEEVASLYRRAGEILGITAGQAQAVSWVAWRNRNHPNNALAFSKHSI